MPRTNLVNTDRELRIDEQIQDGRATARVVEKRRGEVKIEYDSDGATIWLQDNRFEWDETDGWVTV
jgi:hypothetical protein